MSRFVSAQFCDDIRHEVGNKFSLIGCYAGSIQMEPFPSILPKLCVAVKVFTPLDKPFARLVVRVLKGDVLLGEVPFQSDSLVAKPSDEERLAGCQWHTAIAIIVISPFPVDAPCAVRVEADTEEGVLNGGIVLIHGVPKSP